MPAQEVARLVRDHARQLRFVAHAQQQPGEDHREARREHHRVEIGNVRQIDAHVLGRRSADGPDQVLQVADELRILNEQVRSGDLLLDAIHQRPETLLVLVGRLETRADQRLHVPRQHAGLGDAGRQSGCSGASSEEQGAAADLTASAHQFFPVA